MVFGLAAIMLTGSVSLAAEPTRASPTPFTLASTGTHPIPAAAVSSVHALAGPTPTIDGQNGTSVASPCVTEDGLDSGQGPPWGGASCTINLTTTASPDVILLFFTVETNSDPAVAVSVGDLESLSWTERAAFADITPIDFPGTSYPTGCPVTCTLAGYEFWAGDTYAPGVDEITIGFSGSIVSPPSAMAFGVTGVNVADPFDAAGPTISSIPASDYPGASPATGTITTASSNDLIVGLLGLGNTTSSISTGGGGFGPIGAGPPSPAPTPSITLEPVAGANGNTVTVTGSGFSPSDSSVSFSGLGSFTFSCEASYGYVGLAGLTTPCSFVVPTLNIAETGGPLYTVTAVGNVVGGSSDTATAPFDLTPPNLGISSIGPTSGPAGTWVQLTGAFFDESTDGFGSVTIDAPGVAPFSCSVAYGTIGDECQFQIPSGASAPYVITAYGSDYTNVPTDVATTTFDPTYDFSSETGTLSWAEAWGPAPAGGPYTVSASGMFGEWGLIVDAFAPSGPRLAISSTPLEGPVGTPVTVDGTGFTSGQSISAVSWGDTPVGCAGGAPVVSAGAFTCSFNVPPAGAGVYSVTASDAADGTVVSSNTFALTPQLTITGPTSGPAGTSTTLAGTGWTVGATITETEFSDAPFGGSTYDYPACLSAGSAPIVDATGGFACTLTVPTLPTGEYVVSAWDTTDGSVAAATYFVVTTVSATISPGSGPVGTEVTLTAAGLAPGAAYAVDFDPAQTIPATPVTPDGCTDSGGLSGSWITADSTGAFTCTAPVPSAVAADQSYYVDVFQEPSGAFITSVTTPPTGQFEVTGGLTPTVGVSLSPSTISYYESTTVTVTVTGPESGPDPTGEVTISDGISGPGDSCVIPELQPGVITLGVPPYASGSCELTPNPPLVGPLIVTAMYGGDSNYETGSGTATLTVTHAALSLTPTDGSQDETLDVTLGGFTPAGSGMAITFSGLDGGEITVVSLTVAGPSSAVAEITIGAHARTGLYGVLLRFSGGGQLQFPQFRVTKLALKVSPARGSQDETLDTLLSGFTPAPSASDMTVEFSGTGITVDSIAISGLSAITVEVTLAYTAPGGFHDITVTESVSGGFDTDTTIEITDAFHVTPLAVTMSPAKGTQDETLDTVVSGFTPAPSVADMTVEFLGPGVTVDSIAISGISSITLEITIAYDATGGYRNLEITESVSGGGGTATHLDIAKAFRVSKLDVTASPAKGAPGTTLDVTISGFTPAPSASDMTVVFSGEGITVDSIAITGLSSIEVEITIAGGLLRSNYNLGISESVSGGVDTATTLDIKDAFQVE